MVALLRTEHIYVMLPVSLVKWPLKSIAVKLHSIFQFNATITENEKCDDLT